MSEGSANEIRDVQSARPFRNAAREYYRKGYLPFPLPARKKHPPPSGVTGHKARIPVTEEQIDVWMDDEQFAKANIGLKFGNISVEGTEYIVLGIDVDNYDDYVMVDDEKVLKKKEGAKQLAELEEQFGTLPETWISSARADGVSGIRFFLAPTGLSWRGKAAEHIDVIQPGHRFAVVWPSWHPSGGQYLFTQPGQPPDGTLPTLAGYRAVPAQLNHGGSGITWARDPIRIPEAADLPLLPDTWIDFLTRDRTPEQDRPLDMDISVDDLSVWVKKNFKRGKACKETKARYKHWIDRLEEDPSSHDKVLGAHWQFSMMGIFEGHPGAWGALSGFDKAWLEANLQTGKRGLTEAKNEMFRSRTNAWRKIKWEFDHQLKENGIDMRAKACSCPEEITKEQVSEELTEKDNIPAPPGQIKDVEEYERSDWGRAEIFLDLFSRERVKCIQRPGRVDWYFWKLDGTDLGWVQDNELAVRLIRAVGRVYRMKYEQLYAKYKELKVTDPDEAKILWNEKVKPYQGLYEKVGDAATIRRLLEVMKSHTDVMVPEGYFDSKPHLLGFDDGVLVLERGKDWYFRQKEIDDRVTKSVGRPFRTLKQLVDAQDPGVALLRSYRDQFVNNERMWHFIQMIMGYALYGANPDRVIFFFHGVSSTGKSTLLNALYEALGPYAGSSNADIFNDKDGGRNPELLKTRGKRFVQLPEFGEGAWITNDSLKRLASEDPISVRDNYAKSDAIEEFEHTALFIGPTNSVPRINGIDNAVTRRIRVVPFDNVFEEAAENVDLGRLTRTVGREAVLAWAIEGWNRYVRGGMSAFFQSNIPPEVAARTKEFTNEMSAIGDFITDFIEVTGDKKDILTSHAVFQRYQVWAEMQGITEAKQMDQKKLSARISQETGIKSLPHGIEVNGTTQRLRGWKGIKMNMSMSVLKSSGLEIIPGEK